MENQVMTYNPQLVQRLGLTQEEVEALIEQGVSIEEYAAMLGRICRMRFSRLNQRQCATPSSTRHKYGKMRQLTKRKRCLLEYLYISIRFAVTLRKDLNAPSARH